MDITVIMNELHYEYDIRGLVMAFFPKSHIQVQVEDQNNEAESDLKLQVFYLTDTVELKMWGLDFDTVVIPMCWDAPETKNELKRQIYKLLSQYTQKALPWGTLTGIRPVKLPMALLEEGKSDAEIGQHLKDTYLMSDEKINLSVQIAHKELDLLQCLDYEDGYSLYIGIPFCPTTCLYCSFTSYPYEKWASRIEEYLDALEKEILYTAKRFADKKLNSI
jgi:oxygen-independent coproporphyrinogen-3 oxidase